MTYAKRLWNRLGTRLTVLFLSLALIPLLGVGYLAYENGRQTIEQQQFNHLDAVNTLKANELDRWVRDNLAHLGSLAQRPLVRELAVLLNNDPASASAVDDLLANHLRPALAERAGFEELFLLRAGDGLILASTTEKNVGKFRESESYFVEGRQRPTIQNVYYSLSRGEPTMTIGVPLRTGNGQTVAVLAGHVNLDELEAITDQASELTATEDTYLVNKFNFFVTDPRFGESYALQEDIHTWGVAQCLRQQRGSDIYTDYRGMPVLGVYHWLPERELCLLTEIDQAEAFAPIDEFRRSLVRIGSVVALAVVASGLFFTRSITNPLHQLARGANRIGRGDLEHRIDVRSSDEIGQLAGAFNEMTSNLRQSLGETAYGRRLLLALSDAAQAVQRARTQQEIYETVGEEVTRLGFNATVLLLSDDQQRARVAYLGFDSSLIRVGERLAGVSAADYEFPLPSGGTYLRLIAEGETLFIGETREFISEALPAPAHSVADRLVTLLGVEQSIIAPLTVDGETLGLLTVSGSGLAEADVTAVTAFANQTAIALKNAQLYEAIRASEARFRTIFKSAGAGIARLDLDGKAVESNAALQQMLGYSEDELRRRPLVDFSHPDDAVTDQELYGSLVARERERYQVEKRYVHKDGQTVWTLLSVSLVYGGNGEPQFAIALVDDVTQRKEIEQAQFEQQAFLESIYSGADLAIFVVDVGEDGVFRFIGLNPAHERLTGLEFAEIEGKTPEELVPYIPPEAAAAVRDNYARCVEAAEAIEYEEMIPMGGRETWWLTRLSPLRDAERRIHRIVGTSMSITQRKRMEKALRRHQDELEDLVEERTAKLRQSESRFRALFYAAPVPVLVTDAASGKILEANEHVATVLRLDPKEVVGSDVGDLYQDGGERKRRVHMIQEQGHVRNHELIVRRGNGEAALLLLSTSTIEYEGRPALLSSFIDLTERKEMEEALRHSEKRFRALVQNASDIITVIDGEGRVQYDSPSIERLLGYEPDERLGNSVFESAHPEDAPTAIEAFERILADPQTTVALDVQVRHRDGSWRTLEVTASNLLDDPAVGGIVVNSHDITDRTNLEVVLRRERDRFDSLLQTSPVGITFVDRAGQITFANPQAEQVLGLSRDEVVSRTYHAPAWRITDYEGNPYREEELPFVRAREAGCPVHDVQHAIEKPSGERVLLSINAAPVFDHKGAFDGIVATVQDITERKRAQAQLEKYAADLARSNEELQQFAYVASHDLQEPLRMVSSFLQLLQRRYEGQLDERADEYIYYAVDGAARMKMLINDLLQYSRVATKGKPLAPTASQEALDKVLSDLRVTVEESEATITAEPLPVVMADETQLRQLFQNLIGNAIKFHGESSPRVHVSVERQNGMWQFAVSDNGIGIEPQHAERIFVIFQRLHGGGQFEGSGIGLAICKKIVERHGGTLWVESEPGAGSTFYFTLPSTEANRTSSNGRKET